MREAQDLGLELVGNLETRGPYRTGRHLSWDLNFPHLPLLHQPGMVDDKEMAIRFNPLMDASKYDPAAWYDADIAIGHPPCGSHSMLGNSGQPAHKTTEERRAMQTARQSRTGLLPLFIAEVNKLRPKIFALDNLPKIMTTVATPDWWEEQLPDYNLTYVVMLNWDYGTPQIRKRLWVIGTRKPLPPFKFIAPKVERLGGPRSPLDAFWGLPWQPWSDIPEIGHVHVPPDKMLTGDYRTTVEGYSVTQSIELALGFLGLPAGKPWPYTTSRGRLAVKIGRSRMELDRQGRTITGLPSLHHPYTGFPLTARERARLMGWPDDFSLGNENTEYNRTNLMRQVMLTGKAVPSDFPRYLLPQLMKHVKRG